MFQERAVVAAVPAATLNVTAPARVVSTYMCIPDSPSPQSPPGPGGVDPLGLVIVILSKLLPPQAPSVGSEVTKLSKSNRIEQIFVWQRCIMNSQVVAAVTANVLGKPGLLK
eukprot:TRINITY_DN25042_c0_g1_i1.p2 TRINITY_DN25042_c0_g1~~TRINITY_DN25042_c0_g1_i1.p2  ORF type:complete len:112 (-),score=4.41 TRINITY_DN25042_c0_g1_i1:363-698(-)